MICCSVQNDTGRDIERENALADNSRLHVDRPNRSCGAVSAGPADAVDSSTLPSTMTITEDAELLLLLSQRHHQQLEERQKQEQQQNQEEQQLPDNANTTLSDAPSSSSTSSNLNTPGMSSPLSPRPLTSEVSVAGAYTSVDLVDNTVTSSSAAQVQVPVTKLATLYPESRAVVEGDKLEKCEICGYASFRRHHLNRHVLTHTGAKKHKCGFCGFMCSRADALKQHKRTHARENELMCEHCLVEAADKEELDEHFLKEHTFRCVQCDSVYPSLKKLRHHERSHQVFKCRFCQLSSIHAKKVERHERSTHGVASGGGVELVFPVDLSINGGIHAMNNDSNSSTDSNDSNQDRRQAHVNGRSRSANRSQRRRGERPTQRNQSTQRIQSTRMTSASPATFIPPGIIRTAPIDNTNDAQDLSSHRAAVLSEPSTSQQQSPNVATPITVIMPVASGNSPMPPAAHTGRATGFTTVFLTSDEKGYKFIPGQL